MKGSALFDPWAPEGCGDAGQDCLVSHSSIFGHLWADAATYPGVTRVTAARGACASRTGAAALLCSSGRFGRKGDVNSTFFFPGERSTWFCT